MFDTDGRKQLSANEAIEFGINKKYEGLSDYELVDFQLFQERLAVPFSRFHVAISRVFDRLVYTHEFADQPALAAEFRKIKNGKPEVSPAASSQPEA